MNLHKASTVEKIKVMQAFVDGKEVEWKFCVEDEWSPCPSPTWNWTDFNFKVKPKIKEMTVSEIEQQLGYAIKVVK